MSDTRTPKGTRAGGEFAEHSRDEADIELTADGDMAWERPEGWGTVFTFPSERLALAATKIERANRRLEHAGISERFSFDTELNVVNNEGKLIEMATITLNRPSLSFGDWKFTGAHQFTADGQVLSFADERLDFKVEDSHCDHCGKTRQRGSVYTLHSDVEGDKQVGKSCLSAFLGIKPVGLWALESDLDFSDLEPDESDEGFGNYGGSQVYPAEDLVLAAVIASDAGGFTPKSRATGERPATAELVLDNFTGLVENATSSHREKAAEILQWINDQKPEPDNDYMQNLRASIAGDSRWVKTKHVGIAVSVVGAYDNAREYIERQRLRDEQNSKIKKSYLAPPATKVKDIGATILSANMSEGYRPGSTQTLVKMLDDDGHLLTWWASGAKHFEAGDKIVVAATVKKNDEYRDEFQTVLTRAKITDPTTGDLLG